MVPFAEKLLNASVARETEGAFLLVPDSALRLKEFPPSQQRGALPAVSALPQSLACPVELALHVGPVNQRTRVIEDMFTCALQFKPG